MVELQNPRTGTKTTEINAELDSGAEYSLFDGELALAIGLDLYDGELFTFQFANGHMLDARIMPVVISHRDLSSVNLRIRFSTEPLFTNVLGRDFFDFFRIGFEEHQSEVYLGKRE